MKKLNGINSRKVSMALSIALLLPSLGRAESEETSARLGDLIRDTSKVEGVLNSSGVLSGSEESFKEKAEKALKKIQAKFTTNKEEADLRDEVAERTKKNDEMKNLLALPDFLMQKALNKRETDLGTAEKLLTALGKKNQGINPKDFSMNGASEVCRKDVDFTQFMALADQMGSEPFKYLQGEATKLVEEKSEELRKQKAQKLADIIKHFKELAAKDESTDSSKPDPKKFSARIEERLAKLKASEKAGREESKELRGTLVDVFGKFIQDLGSLEKNDKRVHKLGDEFAKSIENNQRAAMMTAQQNVDQLFVNCQKEVKVLKTEIENFKQQLVSRGWDPAVAEADANAQRMRAQKMKCTDVTQNVQSLLMGFGNGGSALSDRLTKIRAEKNPTKLLSEAVSAMQDVANIQQQVGQQLKPLMSDCDDASQGREGLKQRFAQLGAPAGGQASGGTSSTGAQPQPRRSSGTGSSFGTPSTGQSSHGGFAPRQGSF